MSAFTDNSALSSLIKSANLASTSSIELLRINRSTSDTEGRIFYETCGDEILQYIAPGEHLGQACSDSNSATALSNLSSNNKYFLRILQVELLWER